MEFATAEICSIVRCYDVWLCIANRPLALLNYFVCGKNGVNTTDAKCNKIYAVASEKCHSITFKLTFFFVEFVLREKVLTIFYISFSGVEKKS